MRPPRHHDLRLILDRLASLPMGEELPAQEVPENLTRLFMNTGDDALGAAFFHHLGRCGAARALHEYTWEPIGRKLPRSLSAMSAVLAITDHVKLTYLHDYYLIEYHRQPVRARHRVLRAFVRHGFSPDSRWPTPTDGWKMMPEGHRHQWKDLLSRLDDSGWRILFGRRTPREHEWPFLAANRYGLLLRWRNHFPWPADDKATWTRLLESAAGGAPRRVLRYLLERGASVTPKALAGALERQRPDLLALLESHTSCDLRIPEEMFPFQWWYNRNPARHASDFLRHLPSNPGESISVSMDAPTAAALRAYADPRLPPNPRLIAPDRDEPFPLSAAATEAALRIGYSVAMRNDEGDTPLHLTDSPKVVKVLLRHGADPLALNHDGVTAFRTAMNELRAECADLMADTVIRSGNRDRIQALLREWTIVEHKSASTDTWLPARERRRLLTQIFLIESPPDLASGLRRWHERIEHRENARAKTTFDRKGPRFCACHWKVLSRLKEVGADFTERDASGRSLLQIAASGPYHAALLQLLKRPETTGLYQSELLTDLGWETYARDYSMDEDLRLRPGESIPCDSAEGRAYLLIENVRWNTAGWRHWITHSSCLRELGPSALENPLFPPELRPMLEAALEKVAPES